jgi:hypothetical protein
VRWIVVGHSHFDHVWGAERIMRNTRARLVGSYETVRVMESAGVPVDRMTPVAGGETVDLGSGVRVSVYPSQHSCVWSQGQMAPADQSHRRSRAHAAGAAATLRRARRRDDLGGTTLGTLSTTRARAATAARSSTSSGHDSVLCGTRGALDRRAARARPDVAILAAAGQATSTATRSGKPRAVRRAPGRPRPPAASSSAITTTGCRASPSRPTSEPIRRRSRVTPRTALLRLGYLDATAILPV